MHRRLAAFAAVAVVVAVAASAAVALLTAADSPLTLRQALSSGGASASKRTVLR